MQLRKYQEKTISKFWRAYNNGARRVCITAPCGAGKTVMFMAIARQAIERGMKVAVYTNRQLLTSQTSNVFSSNGLSHGVRAAGFAHDITQDLQLCSIQTEYSRVIRRQIWDVHDADIVIVDEAHQMKAMSASKVFDKHENAAILGITATPVDVGHIYKKLITACKPSDLRELGYMLPCKTYAPDQPDIDKMALSGAEYTAEEIDRVTNYNRLVGRVIDWYRILNPDMLPTVLFAPGVQQSKWFVDQFVREGIPSAHIDGDNVYRDGHLITSSVAARNDVINDLKEGNIKILCNRFVLREAIDIPELYHCIMACPIGSPVSYLQSGGRLLRPSPGLDHVILQDHGGNCWTHGSLNEDRQWSLKNTEAGLAKKARRERKKVEKLPYICPRCHMVRKKGVVCPGCGLEVATRDREVIQKDGTLRKVTEFEMLQARAIKERSPEERAWWNVYYAMKKYNTGIKMRRVGQAYRRNTGKWPGPHIPGVPEVNRDWELSIAEYDKKRKPYYRALKRKADKFRKEFEKTRGKVS